MDRLDKIVVGERIKALRTQRGWTQRELAEKIGRNQPVLGKWELGDHMVPDESLEKLAEVFSVDVSWFTEAGTTSDPGKALFNPMLESAKQVLRMHGMEAVTREEYELLTRAKRLYAPGPDSNSSKRAKVLRNFESGSHAFQPAHTAPAFIPDHEAGFKTEVLAHAPDINWGPLLGVGYAAEAQATTPRRPDDDTGGKLVLATR